MNPGRHTYSEEWDATGVPEVRWDNDLAVR
jgi:hypothetical protein